MEPRIRLSTLSPGNLWLEFLRSPYSKWGTLCLLRYLGFHTLDALFIHWTTSEVMIREAVTTFTSALGFDKVLVRTDAVKEEGAYPRAGNTISTDRAIRFLLQLKTTHRVAILMHPTNRFTNRRAIVLHMLAAGEFRIEVLGPGFDVSDLNRGLVPPELSVQITNINWETYDPPHPLFVTRRTNPVGTLRKIRLQRIGAELLPAMGIKPSGPPHVFAEAWLRENGFFGLFEDSRPTLTYRKIQKLYDVAILIGSAYRRKSNWDSLVVICSDLGNGSGLIFWDVLNPMEKFRVTG